MLRTRMNLATPSGNTFHVCLSLYYRIPKCPRTSVRNLAPYRDSVLPHADRMESFGISVPAAGDAQLAF
jgi:hypothetical protein